MRIVLTGAKGTGKSKVGARLAEILGVALYETDEEICVLYAEKTGERLTCREIMRREGEAKFRELEAAAVARVAQRDWCVIATGGGTMLHSESRRILRQGSVLVLLECEEREMWERVKAGGVPAYAEGGDVREEVLQRAARIVDVMRPYADVVVDTTSGVEDAVVKVLEGVACELAVRMQAANTFGEVIRVTTFGESHGPAIGCVLDGVRPGIEISVAEVQRELDRRRPGQSAVSTPRKERDQVRILSGIFEGKTTGAPICMVLMSEDQRPSAYEGLRDVFRPGHADFTFWKKYGIRDYRGGGRSSGRETAGRVAAGAVAKQILARRGVSIVASAIEIGGVKARSYDPRVIEQNPVRCADAEAAREMEAAILTAKAAKDSVGGVIELRINGVPAGLGDPVFGKLDARLAGAILSIGATTGFEIGSGFAAARMRGSEHNDQMRDGRFLTNHAGGISGGISNGNEIVIRVAIKPTSSIERPQQTMDIYGANREIVVEGRHDPCIVPRVIPVIEAMAALVVLDAWEIQERIRPGWTEQD